MRSLIAQLALLLLVFFSTANARADILFVDINNSPKEIISAQNAAKVRGEQLVIIPKRTPAEQRILDALHDLKTQKDTMKAHEDSIQGQIANALRQNETARASELEATLKNVREVNAPRKSAIDQQMAKLPNPISFTADVLKAQFADATRAGHKFTSLVLSGEHSTDDFFGQSGEISKTDFGKFLTTTRALQHSLRSVYGLGCYDATYEMVGWFKQAIPGLEMIAGYDKGAPKSDRPANLDFLYGGLTREKSIIKASDEAKASSSVYSMIRAIPGFNQTHAAIYTANACYSSTSGIITQESQAGSCNPDVYDSVCDGDLDFHPMLLGYQNGGDVPCDTNHSWLRSYYDNLRTHEHCGESDDPIGKSYHELTGNADKVIRMIYFQNVVANFAKANATDLKELQKISGEHQPAFPFLPLDGPVSCDTSTGTSRQSIDNWIASLSSQESSLSSSEQGFVESLQAKMKAQLTKLECVPSGWLDEPGAEQPQKPTDSCLKNAERD